MDKNCLVVFPEAVMFPTLEEPYRQWKWHKVYDAYVAIDGFRQSLGLPKLTPEAIGRYIREEGQLAGRLLDAVQYSPGMRVCRLRIVTFGIDSESLADLTTYIPARVIHKVFKRMRDAAKVIQDLKQFVAL